MPGSSRRDKALKVVRIAGAAAGLAASLALVFQGGDARAARGCVVGGCGRLAQVVEGTFLGLPLSLWGVLYWTGALFLVLKAAGYGTGSAEGWNEAAAFWLALGGAFSLGLVWLQFAAGAWCGLCLVSAGAALILGTTAFIHPRREA